MYLLLSSEFTAPTNLEELIKTIAFRRGNFLFDVLRSMKRRTFSPTKTLRVGHYIIGPTNIESHPIEINMVIIVLVSLVIMHGYR